MDAIDKLLAELQDEYAEVKSVKPKPQQQITPIKSVPTSSSKSNSLIDSLLSEVKADFLEKDAEEEFQKKQELEQEKLRQAQLKVKELESLKKRSKEWLSKLDPFSSEGLWFERFAEAYPSKLDAAIEYLQTNE